MDLRDLITKRYRVTRFHPDEVSDVVLRGLIAETLRSLPAGRLQPWRFIVIRDDEKKEELVEVCYGQEIVADAPLVVACLGDIHECDRAVDRIQEELDAGETWGRTEMAIERTKRALDLDPAYREQVATQSAYLAAEYLSLATWREGLGTCTIGWYDEEGVHRVLDLPAFIETGPILLIGRPADEPPRTERRGKVTVARPDDVTFRNEYGTPHFD